MYLIIGQSKTHVLVSLRAFMIKVQTYEWQSEAQSFVRANHHYEDFFKTNSNVLAG